MSERWEGKKNDELSKHCEKQINELSDGLKKHWEEKLHEVWEQEDELLFFILEQFRKKKSCYIAFY